MSESVAPMIVQATCIVCKRDMEPADMRAAQTAGAVVSQTGHMRANSELVHVACWRREREIMRATRIRRTFACANEPLAIPQYLCPLCTRMMSHVDMEEAEYLLTRIPGLGIVHADCFYAKVRDDIESVRIFDPAVMPEKWPDKKREKKEKLPPAEQAEQAAA